ncbi:MAG: type VII toxin-antitoxin system MntA family adenylyltransferase antitoxin [Thermoanaerobaculia bacterium]
MSAASLTGQIAGALQPRPEILEAYLFGSRAREDANPESDTDVAVLVDRSTAPDPPFGYAAALAADLTTALGGGAVDVVVLNDAPPLLYHRVLRDGIRLLARDLRATTTREGRALSRYCDYVTQLRKIDVAHSTRIAEGDFGR